jgi:hypothetical protein
MIVRVRTVVRHVGGALDRVEANALDIRKPNEINSFALVAVARRPPGTPPRWD